MGYAHFLARRFDEAVPKLLLAIQDNPTAPNPLRNLASCYAHMGRLEGARDIWPDCEPLRTLSCRT